MQRAKKCTDNQRIGCFSIPFYNNLRFMKQLRCLFFLTLAVSLLFGCATKTPTLGMQDGKFAQCDQSDCVSSQSTDEKYKIAPIKASGSPEIVMVDLGKAVESIFGGKVLVSEGNYLRAEFRSSVTRTMDDAEFHYNQQAGEIEVYAVSRGELLDFSSNRERIEELRTIFANQ